MRLSKRERILLIVVIILALGAVYYFYFLNPFMADMKKLDEDIQQKQARLQMLNVQETQLKLLNTQIADLQKENTELLKKIPTGFSQPELLYTIQKLVEENAKKTSYSFELPVDLIKLDSTKATLSFTTDYTKLKKLLAGLKESVLNNRILTLTISTAESAFPAAADTKPGTGDMQDLMDAAAAITTKGTADTKGTQTPATTPQNTTTETPPVIDKNYNLQVIVEMEFFNLKGDAANIQAWNNFKKGRPDLFS